MAPFEIESMLWCLQNCMGCTDWRGAILCNRLWGYTRSSTKFVVHSPGGFCFGFLWWILLTEHAIDLIIGHSYCASGNISGKESNRIWELHSRKLRKDIVGVNKWRTPARSIVVHMYTGLHIFMYFVTFMWCNICVKWLSSFSIFVSRDYPLFFDLRVQLYRLILLNNFCVCYFIHDSSEN